MRIKFVQKIIDKIRRKKQKKIKGTNNIVLIKSNNKTIKLNKKFNGSIVGDGNTIIFHSNNLNKFPSGLYIVINGNENYIEIHEPNFINSYIEFRGDSSKFILNKTCKPVIGASFFLGEGGTIEIEKDCELGNSALWVVVNGDYESKHKLFIGEGTHIAKDAIIRTSDGECLLDFETNKPISEPQDIYIGKHSWITSRCTILKGTHLPNNTVVGANSLVNKKFTQENTLIAGSPATVIKERVKWNENSYCENMQLYLNNQNKK